MTDFSKHFIIRGWVKSFAIFLYILVCSGDYTRMLQAILNKSWRQDPTKQQLYSHQPPITKTIKVRQTRHCWRSRDKLINDVLLWNPSHGRAKAGRPGRTYVQQLCAVMGCSSEELLEVMNDKEGWWEGVKDVCADGMTCWWWYHVTEAAKSVRDIHCG